MPSTTSVASAVSRHARRLKDAFRFVRSRATRKQDDEYTRGIAKACLSSEKSKAIEHVTTLIVDIARRGELAEAESLGHEFIAIARAEYLASHPTEQTRQLSVDEAGLAEQAAQGERECAEKAMDLFPTATNKLRFLASSLKYSAAAGALDAAVRRELAASP